MFDDRVDNHTKHKMAEKIVCINNSTINISTKFLTIDPAHWHNQDDYEIIKSLKIVNDTAEWGVKLHYFFLLIVNSLF